MFAGRYLIDATLTLRAAPRRSVALVVTGSVETSQLCERRRAGSAIMRPDVQRIQRGARGSTVAFSAVGAVLVLASVAAFWTPYFSHPTSITEPYVHGHVFFVALWMSALIAQPLLIRARRLDLHRAIGRASFALAPLVAISALLLAHSRFDRMDEATFARSAFTLYLPVMSTAAFLASYVLAVAYRRDRAAHAAFMSGTAFALIEPIAVRLVFFYTPAGEVHWVYDVIGIALVGTILTMLIAASRHVPRARNAFVALLVLFGTLSVGWFTLARTHGWAAFARWFVDLPLT